MRATAQRAFTATRAIVEKIPRDQPDYATAWSVLGRIDAKLGRKVKAVREGRRACELLPLSTDAWRGPTLIINLAQIHAWDRRQGSGHRATDDRSASAPMVCITAN
jgi:hypothetical protein